MLASKAERPRKVLDSNLLLEPSTMEKRTRWKALAIKVISNEIVLGIAPRVS